MKYNDIGLNLKKLFGRVFAVLLCLSVVFFAACSQDEQDPGEGEQEQPTVTEETGDYISASRGYGQGGLICTPEAFAAAKDGWFRSDGKISKLLSDEANDASLTEVTAGETYYYVYSWNVQYESLPEEYDVHHIGSEETYTSAFRLSVLPGDGKMYFNNAAVTSAKRSCARILLTVKRTFVLFGSIFLTARTLKPYTVFRSSRTYRGECISSNGGRRKARSIRYRASCSQMFLNLGKRSGERCSSAAFPAT